MSYREMWEAGFIVTKHVPLHADLATRENPFLLHPVGSLCSYGRFRTKTEAVAYLHECLTSIEDSSVKSQSQEFIASRAAKGPVRAGMMAYPLAAKGGK